MISLALAGKIPVTEDPLTAALLDVLRYADDPRLLANLLTSSAMSLTGARIVPSFDAYQVQPWPLLAGREPDARINLFRDGRPACRLILEAKLGAAKSGDAEVEIGAGAKGDQLAYYLLAEAVENGGTDVALLYLTHHPALPRADLAASAAELKRLGRSDLVDALFWSSWRDVEQRLVAACTETRWCADLRRLLRKAKMYRFTSFSLDDAPPRVQSDAAWYVPHRARVYPDARDLSGAGLVDWMYGGNGGAWESVGILTSSADFYRG